MTDLIQIRRELQAILAAPVQGEAVEVDRGKRRICHACATWPRQQVCPVCDGNTPPQPTEVGELVERMKDAECNEKHWNVQQTRYWCNQYKLLAHAALAKLEGKA